MAEVDAAPPWAVERLIRELLAELLLGSEELERRLGWSPGRLGELMEGRTAVGFADLMPVLEALGKPPVELLARLYNLSPGDFGLFLPSLSPRFEESRRVLREAIRRRSADGRSGGENG
jgi:transcriptional regulator with XRE-family HTH domain